MADGEKDLIRAGGMWANKDRNGRTYLNGKLGSGVRILIFPNNFRRDEKDPTHTMYFGQVEKVYQGGDDLSDEQQDDLSDLSDPFAGADEAVEQAESLVSQTPPRQQPAQNAQRGYSNGRR